MLRLVAFWLLRLVTRGWLPRSGYCRTHFGLRTPHVRALRTYLRIYTILPPSHAPYRMPHFNVHTVTVYRTLRSLPRYALRYIHCGYGWFTWLPLPFLPGSCPLPVYRWFAVGLHGTRTVTPPRRALPRCLPPRATTATVTLQFYTITTACHSSCRSATVPHTGSAGSCLRFAVAGSPTLRSTWFAGSAHGYHGCPRLYGLHCVRLPFVYLPLRFVHAFTLQLRTRVTTEFRLTRLCTDYLPRYVLHLPVVPTHLPRLHHTHAVYMRCCTTRTAGSA